MSTLDSRIVNIALPAIIADLQVALTVDAFPMAEKGRDLKIYTRALENRFKASFQRAMLDGAGVAVLGIVVAYLRGRYSGRTKG
jgi:hypothetical protein